MIDLMFGSERDRYPDLFDKMFRLRHQVFKERLGWDVRSINGMEIDEFDECNPAYFISRDSSGELNACWRLLPSTGPNMLRDTFPYLMDGQAIPTAEDVWEASRFAVSGKILDSKNLTSLNKVTAELLCAMYEFGVSIGMTEVVTVCDVAVARLVQRMGYAPRWKTRPRRLGSTITVAVGYEVSPRVVNYTQQRYGFETSMLRVASNQDIQKVA